MSPKKKRWQEKKEKTTKSQNRLSDADGINQGYNTQGPSCRQPPFLETRNACLLFRLLIEANDVSYCIHAPIHLCLFPSLSHHLRGHLASVISSCNESSRARHRLKMILVILIRGPYFNQITFCESRDEISDHQGVEELS